MTIESSEVCKVLDDGAGKHESSHSGDVRKATVGVYLSGMPCRGASRLCSGIAVGERRRLRREFTAVGEHLVRKNAKELPSWHVLFALEAFAQRPCKRTAFHFPEFGTLQPCRIHLPCRSHRRNEAGLCAAGMAYEVGLFGQGVDGVDNGIVILKVESRRCGAVVDHSQRLDLEVRVDLEQTFAQRLHFGASDIGDGSHNLPVDVGDIHTVGVDDGEVSDAAAHQTFGTPTAYSPHSEYDDTALLQALQGLVAEEEGGTAEEL